VERGASTLTVESFEVVADVPNDGGMTRPSVFRTGRPPAPLFGAVSKQNCRNGLRSVARELARPGCAVEIPCRAGVSLDGVSVRNGSQLVTGKLAVRRHGREEVVNVQVAAHHRARSA
jgi:hypothetical protein